MATTQNLPFVFNAFFDDGDIIAQTIEDKSMHKEGKSAFFDVMEKQKTNKLIQFAIIGKDQDDKTKMLAVDLERGKFYANGIEFSLEGQDEELTNRKVIYFREVFQHNTMANGVEAPYVKRIFIGYEGKNEEGKVVKKIVNVEV